MQPLESHIPKLLEKLPFAQRKMAQLLHVSEGENGLSWMSFLRDTMVAWLPKLIVSRSLIEISENTFLEFLESGVVYFSVPLSAKRLQPLFIRQAGKVFSSKAGNAAFDSSLMGKSVDELLELAKKPGGEVIQKQLPHLLSAKAATILGSMVAIGLGGEYLINYGKNLMTAKVFKKDKFSDVINLSQGSMSDDQPSEVVKRSSLRLLTTLGLMAGTMVGALGLVRFGHKLPLTKLVRYFDFDTKKGGFSLAKNQFHWYMAASLPAYADAARDNLERVEAVSRLGMVMGYLGWGQQALENGMIRLMKRFTPDLYLAMTRPEGPSGKRSVLKLSEVAQKAFTSSAVERGGQAYHGGNAATLLNNADQLLKAAAEQPEIRKAIVGKNILFGVPLVFGILGTGMGVSLLNQFWTRYRYNKAQAPLAVLTPSSAGQSNTFLPSGQRLNSPVPPIAFTAQRPITPYGTPTVGYRSAPNRTLPFTSSPPFSYAYYS